MPWEKAALDMQPEFKFDLLEVPQVRERYNRRRSARTTSRSESKGDSDMELDDGDEADTEYDSAEEVEDGQEDTGNL